MTGIDMFSAWASYCSQGPAWRITHAQVDAENEKMEKKQLDMRRWCCLSGLTFFLGTWLPGF